MKDMTVTIAVLLHTDGEHKPSFLGTAFAFRKKTHYLAAAHCVGALKPTELSVASAVLNGGHPVAAVTITRHPEADIAVVEIADQGTYRVQPLFIVAKSYGYGDEVAALGFSEDSMRDGTVKPIGRIFRGFLQRFFDHNSHLGYEYRAAEVSFPSPAGLSGGPVFTMPHGIHVVGLMAENFQSTTYLHAVEEVQDATSHYKETIKQVIQYGVVVRFDEQMETWLNRAVGPEF
jgi:hypothetical protein